MDSKCRGTTETIAEAAVRVQRNRQRAMAGDGSLGRPNLPGIQFVFGADLGAPMRWIEDANHSGTTMVAPPVNPSFTFTSALQGNFPESGSQTSAHRLAGSDFPVGCVSEIFRAEVEHGKQLLLRYTANKREEERLRAEMKACNAKIQILVRQMKDRGSRSAQSEGIGR